ncbi:MAG: hypothetical protein AB8I08_01720 [Sandaracinaceae bacterium]
MLGDLLAPGVPAGSTIPWKFGFHTDALAPTFQAQGFRLVPPRVSRHPLFREVRGRPPRDVRQQIRSRDVRLCFRKLKQDIFAFSADPAFEEFEIVGEDKSFLLSRSELRVGDLVELGVR